jgi:predicted nuclease of predicted toxin-antitoxin system
MGERGPDPGDPAILQSAADEGRILVTLDKDFGELIFLHSAPHAGLIRLPNVPVPERMALLARLLAEYRGEDLSNAIVTVEEGKTRITRRSSR